ncbi:unnamed protein product [Scytosiphon promiscuus]
MNPTQYKQAMKQRQLERRVELERSTQEPSHSPGDRGGSLGSTHPRGGAPSAAGGGDHCRSMSKMQHDFEDGEGGSAAISLASSAGGGGLVVEGFGLHGDQLRHPSLYSSEDGISPLAPGPLVDHWSSYGADLSGFDRQAELNSMGNTGTGSVAAVGDVWGEKEDDFSFSSEQELPQRRRPRGVRVLNWDDKLPGETSITQGVRLYLANVYPEATHEENCALVLYQASAATGGVLEHVAEEELDVVTLKTRHIIKIEAFLRSVVLSVPAKTWQQSVRGALARTAPAGISISAGHGQQISKEELTFRMSLFVAMMRAEKDGVGEDKDASVDVMRVEAVVRGYAANAAEILPLQRPARTLLPPLLYCMACEVLHVRLLGPEVREVCRQIVSDYETRAKLWMSPAQNAERFLRPLVTEFASWLRTNRDVLYQGSATEGLLRSIDEGLRHSLKTQVYRSPEHFLQVLRSLSARLTDMPLPSYDPSGGDDHPFDVSQTLKDVSRERFDVNKVPTEPSRCWSQIRALLLKAAYREMNHPQPHPHPHYQTRVRSTATRPPDAAFLQPDTGGSRVATDAVATAANPTRTAQPQQAIRREEEEPGGPSDESAGPGRGQPSRRCAAASSGDAAAGNETVIAARGDGGAGRGDGCGGADIGGAKSALEAYVDQCAWRVLHAASRTASGGDSFFVVQDLFGGEGVLVKMATAATEPIRIRTKGLAVRVTTVDKHDIYHISDVDMTTSEASPRPLMTITTTMKEVIQFAPFVQAPLVRRKSGLTAERARSTGAEGSASIQQQQQQQLPSHARSGRFITISADLPDYPEDHLDATSGVLLASSDAALSHPEEQASLEQAQPPAAARTTLPDGQTASRKEILEGNGATSAQASPAGDSSGGPGGGKDIISSGSSSSSNSSSSNSISNQNKKVNGNGVIRRRPSIFNSPPALPTPKAWARLNGDGSSSGSSSDTSEGERSREASSEEDSTTSRARSDVYGDGGDESGGQKRDEKRRR